MAAFVSVHSRRSTCVGVIDAVAINNLLQAKLARQNIVWSFFSDLVSSVQSVRDILAASIGPSATIIRRGTPFFFAPRDCPLFLPAHTANVHERHYKSRDAKNRSPCRAGQGAPLTGALHFSVCQSEIATGLGTGGSPNVPEDL